ncbi:MAG: DNA adenine methylase, partial [Candidatus Omnitrophica bacterium]|nr:DNA adenine methylase [Candidatus Omnitrophota bacterium]
DPPYYQKGADLYMNAYSEKDHQALSQYVHKIEKKWMLSYDNHEFILNLYKKENKFIYKLFQSTSNRVGDEVLFFSNGLSFNQSMSRLNDSVII